MVWMLRRRLIELMRARTARITSTVLLQTAPSHVQPEYRNAHGNSDELLLSVLGQDFFKDQWTGSMLTDS
jgi:hypothetical protein